MDQVKIGSLLKELRKEKGLTQEQLAEHFYVSSRSVSRWETGKNMPELSLLVELADFYDVDIREIINGERKSENMNQNEKDTLRKVADYAENEKDIIMKRVRIISFVGLGSLLLELLFESIGIGQINPLLLFIENVAFGFAIGALVTCILFTTGSLSKMQQNKKVQKVSRRLRFVCFAVVILCFLFCVIATIKGF